MLGVIAVAVFLATIIDGLLWFESDSDADKVGDSKPVLVKKIIPTYSIGNNNSSYIITDEQELAEVCVTC